MAQENAGTQEAKSLDVIYELAMRQLDAQLKEFDGIDTKLGLVFGVSTVIIGFLLTSLPSPDLISAQRLLILIVPVALYLTTFVLAALSYRLRSLEYPPDTGRMYEESLFWEPAITKRQVLRTLVSAIDKNTVVIRGKAKWATPTIYLLAFEAIAAIGSGVMLHLP